ncbi:MAG: DMT family transporter [Halodesulfurarchaeum sp.]
MKFEDVLSDPRATAPLFVLLALLWGAAFVAIEIGLHAFPPLYFAGIRYLLAGGVLLGLAVMTAPEILPRTRADYLSIGVMGIFLIFANNAFLYLGEQIVSGAIAAIVVSLAPVLTVLFASLTVERGLPRLHELVGFVLGLIGVVVVAQPDPASLDLEHLFGIGLVFLAAASFAAGGVLSRTVRSGLPLKPLQAWSMLSGSLLLFAVGTLRGESLAGVSLTATDWLVLGYLVLFSGVLAYLLYFTLLEQVGPTQLNLVSYFEPIAAALVAWVVLGEVISGHTVVGFVLVMGGFTAIRRDLVVRLLDSPLRQALRSLGDRGDARSERYRPTGAADPENPRNR